MSGEATGLRDADKQLVEVVRKYDQGCTIEWVSKQLGHRDIHITLKHYARFVKRVDDRMQALLDQMGEEDEAAIRETQ